MKSRDYLQRTGIGQTDLKADLKALKYLQRQHLLHIPFENLDIHWKRPIVLDFESFYRKIVLNRRGGFCYELNGLFSQLLTRIGFRSKIISARPAGQKGVFGPEYDHLAILAGIGDGEFLVDVGFGDFTAEPLRFAPDVEQKDSRGIFLIRRFDEDHFEVVKKDSDHWKSEYIFSTKPRELAEFAGMCRFHQTSPDSHFTRGKICTLMTKGGRKTLTDSKFIDTKSGQKKETPVDSEADFQKILAREFGIMSFEI